MEFTVNGIVPSLPSSPSEGDSYIVDDSGTAIDEQVGRWNGVRWVFTPPEIGDHARVVNNDIDQSYQFTYNGWQSMGNPNIGHS